MYDNLHVSFMTDIGISRATGLSRKLLEVRGKPIYPAGLARVGDVGGLPGWPGFCIKSAIFLRMIPCSTIRQAMLEVSGVMDVVRNALSRP